MQNDWRGKGQCEVYCCNHQNQTKEGQGRRRERNVPGTGEGEKKDSQHERMENWAGWTFYESNRRGKGKPRCLEIWVERGHPGTRIEGAMGFEVEICASENQKNPCRAGGEQQYSSSCSTVVRTWQAEGTVGARAWVRGTCRNFCRICNCQADPCSWKSPIYFL